MNEKTKEKSHRDKTWIRILEVENGFTVQDFHKNKNYICKDESEVVMLIDKLLERKKL